MSHKLAAKYTVAIRRLREQAESGQNSLEYIGIALIAGIIIAAIGTALSGSTITSYVSKFTSQIFTHS